MAEENPEERRKLLLVMLDAVYVDAKEERRIVAIKPKAPFQPIFQVATMKEGSGIVLVQDTTEKAEKPNQPPPNGHEADGTLCSWWRRGRVELHLKHRLAVLVYMMWAPQAYPVPISKGIR